MREDREMSSRVLVLFAHGSADERWRATCEGLASQVAASLGEGRVRVAYLQMAEPTLESVAAELERTGCETVVILPLFFSAGGHVAKDVPRVVDLVRSRHPSLSLEVLPPVGEDERFSGLVTQLSKEALAGG